MKAQITITFDADELNIYTDQHLASLWHVAQVNPQDGFLNKEPGELAEKIGREIIRRFLAITQPPLWKHQGRHFHIQQLRNKTRSE